LLHVRSALPASSRGNDDPGNRNAQGHGRRIVYLLLLSRKRPLAAQHRRSNNNPMPEKIIRDPVHDVIAFRMERPADALLFRLLNAAEFQRLRRIRQLGMASLAYPGADHSRYSHSLGVMETARKILDQLRRSCLVDEEA